MKKIKTFVSVLLAIVFMVFMFSGCKHECIGEWAITKERTIISAGIEERTCSECGEKEVREIPALGESKANELLKGTWSADDLSSMTLNSIVTWVVMNEGYFVSYAYLGALGLDTMELGGGKCIYTDKTIICKYSDSDTVWATYGYILKGESIELYSLTESGEIDTRMNKT